MVFKNINFWNVAEIKLDQETNAYRLFRVREKCEVNMLDQGRNMNHTSIGVELRFKMIDEEVEIVLKTKGEAFGNAYIYFGSTQGEWNQSSFVIKNQDTVIKLKRNNIESILIPMFGGLTGCIHPQVIAKMMLYAYEQVQNPPQEIRWENVKSLRQ